MEMPAALKPPKPVAPYPLAARSNSASLFRTAVGAAAVPLAFLPIRVFPNDVSAKVDEVITVTGGLVEKALLISRLDNGAAVPIPMLPMGLTKKRDVPPIMKLIDPLKAPPGATRAMLL